MRAVRRWVVAGAVALAAAALPAAVAAADGDVGYRGPSSAGIDNSAPTGAKPQSRLWWNDGSWWGILFDTSNAQYRIWRLDRATQTWINTGVAVDDRNQSRGDALWDGTHLYVASHIFVDNGGSASPGQEARLYRYSYDAGTGTYSLDTGFPVQISPNKSEALVLEKDSTGKLWATWAQGSQVWVNRTMGDDRTWGTPFVLPFTQAQTLSFDDLSSMVSFGGNRVGVMWSHQVDDAFYFAEHRDGDPDETWALSTALQGTDFADDHVNLKADSSGRVFAAVKTSLTTSTSPMVFLLVRDPSTGTWSNHVVSLKADRHTRPIVMVDEVAGVVMVFATAGEAGGKIYKKISPIDSIAFASGRGAVFISDATSEDVNDATSTKRTVSSATGLAVLASDDTTDYYWHNFDALVLDASFTASRTTGAAPLTVKFSDTSSGNPSSWSWNFGDGTPASTAQNPSHVYDAPGTYTVTLTATTPSGVSDTETKTSLVTVTPAAVFSPTDDTWVRNTAPDANYGKQATFSVRASAATNVYQRGYIRFDVTGLTAPVTEAKLRFWVTDGSKDGGNVYVVGTNWTETTLTWNNAPPLGASSVASAGEVTTGTWVEIELPASLFSAGNGTYAFAIADGINDTSGYASRQTATAANKPQLVLGRSG